MRLWDSIKLFVANSFFGAYCCSRRVWKHLPKFKKLYSVGEKRLEKEFDIVRIMRNIMDLKICIRNSIMDDNIKKEI